MPISYLKSKNSLDNLINRVYNYAYKILKE